MRTCGMFHLVPHKKKHRQFTGHKDRRENNLDQEKTNTISLATSVLIPLLSCTCTFIHHSHSLLFEADCIFTPCHLSMRFTGKTGA